MFNIYWFLKIGIGQRTVHDQKTLLSSSRSNQNDIRSRRLLFQKNEIERTDDDGFSSSMGNEMEALYERFLLHVESNYCYLYDNNVLHIQHIVKFKK